MKKAPSPKPPLQKLLYAEEGDIINHYSALVEWLAISAEEMPSLPTEASPHFFILLACLLTFVDCHDIMLHNRHLAY